MVILRLAVGKQERSRVDALLPPHITNQNDDTDKRKMDDLPRHILKSQVSSFTSSLLDFISLQLLSFRRNCLIGLIL